LNEIPPENFFCTKKIRHDLWRSGFPESSDAEKKDCDNSPAWTKEFPAREKDDADTHANNFCRLCTNIFHPGQKNLFRIFFA
jgi:hypothetical protein